MLYRLNNLTVLLTLVAPGSRSALGTPAGSTVPAVLARGPLGARVGSGPALSLGGGPAAALRHPALVGWGLPPEEIQPVHSQGPQTAREVVRLDLPRTAQYGVHVLDPSDRQRGAAQLQDPVNRPITLL